MHENEPRQTVSERAYDPELAPLIPLLPTVVDWSDVPRARAEMAAMSAAVEPVDMGVEFTDREVRGPAGAPPVKVRIYRPRDSAKPLPGVLYIHGGGFCVGSVEGEHLAAMGTAAGAEAVVVSVEYRLAPENPFPAGIEDCYAALTWMAARAGDLGIDSSRIAVMGGSAGGGLAAGITLMARDRGGPALCFQVLNIPELDDRLDTPSMRAFTDTPIWNRPSAEVSWRYYLGNERPEVSPYAAPARAEDLAGLPAAYVSTMEFDPLRDEGIRYALRLLEHGVSVELHQYPGTFHGSSMFPQAAVSRRANREMVEALRRGLRK